MSSRSRDAQLLARLLTEHAETDVQVTYHGHARDHHGGWHIAWTDGPTVTSMRTWVVTLKDLHELGLPVRAYDRASTDLAVACALLSWLTKDPENASDANWVTPGVARDVYDQTEHPEDVSEVTHRWARVLIGLGFGAASGAVVHQVRMCVRDRGVQGLREWLDSVTPTSTPARPGVVDFEAARRRRGNRLPPG